MERPQQTARVNEACPLSLVWTNGIVGHRIIADDETGSDGRQQLREFENLPCRTVREALKTLLRIHA